MAATTATTAASRTRTVPSPSGPIAPPAPPQSSGSAAALATARLGSRAPRPASIEPRRAGRGRRAAGERAMADRGCLASESPDGCGQRGRRSAHRRCACGDRPRPTPLSTGPCGPPRAGRVPRVAHRRRRSRDPPARPLARARRRRARSARSPSAELGAARVMLDASGLEALDLTGAYFLRQLELRLEAAGAARRVARRAPRDARVHRRAGRRRRRRRAPHATTRRRAARHCSAAGPCGTAAAVREALEFLGRI